MDSRRIARKEEVKNENSNKRNHTEGEKNVINIDSFNIFFRPKYT